MADHDLSFLVGELKGEFKAIKDHLTDQDRQAQRVESKVDGIGVQTAEHAEWIKLHGRPMAEEWARSKERKKIAAAEFRGRAMTWAKIGGASTILITGIGYLGRDAVAAVLRKVASLLS